LFYDIVKQQSIYIGLDHVIVLIWLDGVHLLFVALVSSPSMGVGLVFLLEAQESGLSTAPWPEKWKRGVYEGNIRYLTV